MDELLKALRDSDLFAGIEDEMIAAVVKPEACIVGNYGKDALIVTEGEPLNSIGIVLSGGLAAQHITPSGDVVTVSMFFWGDCFGPGILVKDPPVHALTLVTTMRTRILYLAIGQVRMLLDQSIRFNKNYIALMTRRLETLLEKVCILSCKDVRGRLCLYLGGEARRMHSPAFTLAHTKTDIAGLLGVARPSLSRELRRMSDEGLIEMAGNRVRLRDAELFGLGGREHVRTILF